MDPIQLHRRIEETTGFFRNAFWILIGARLQPNPPLISGISALRALKTSVDIRTGSGGGDIFGGKKFLDIAPLGEEMGLR